MRSRLLTALAVMSLLALSIAAAERRSAEKTFDVDSLQYDGQGPWKLLNVPGLRQGLDTLFSRGRVKPEELLVVGKAGGPKQTLASDRTIFRDEVTGAEVWRITNFPWGVIRHAYSGIPAWNANGRFIQFNYATRGTLLFDQEKCTLSFVGFGGEWSPTEPNMLYSTGQWEGHGAVVAIDMNEGKAVRALAPVRGYAGVSPVSSDGKWVCFREGTQDTATTFGLAATDGSSYTSIATNGGVVVKRTPVTFDPLPAQPTLAETKGGIHQMYFTRRGDRSVLTNCHGDEPHARLFTPDGKMIAGFENFTHQSWEPAGKYVLYMKAGVVALDPETKKQWTVLNTAGTIEGHTTWNSFDPSWAAMSWRSRTGGEIIRLSMRDDHSVARLCESCPMNPDTTAYNNDEFGCMSADGTKVLFMSTMSGSVNEYLVVAANPRPPARLTGAWTADGYTLAWTPDALSREVKGYRVCRTSKTGQDYREVAFVPVPETRPIPSTEPMSFVVKDVKKGEGAFFAVRAQEWSGLVSRYSGEVSADDKPVAACVEPELLDFTGFKQGFDPLDAGDMYYLFVPKEGTACSVTFTNDRKDSQVWVRVGGKDVAFTVNKSAPAKKSYNGWTWVSLGGVTGKVTIASDSAGFKLDRVLITPEKGGSPVGRGPDYRSDAAFEAQVAGGVQARALNPFTAEVTWQPVAGARYYNVYAGDKADFTPAQSNLLYSPPAGTERVIDWGLRPGSAVHYKVVAFDCDGAATKPSESAEAKTGPLVARTVDVEYETGTGGTVEDDKAASGGKCVLLGRGQTVELKFSVPADGDYVFWHAFRADGGQAVRSTVKIDGNRYTIEDTYDLAALGGRALRKDWEWSRYTFRWSRDLNGVLHLKAGEHSLSISADSSPIHLDKLVITNDQSWVPAGRLCSF